MIDFDIILDNTVACRCRDGIMHPEQGFETEAEEWNCERGYTGGGDMDTFFTGLMQAKNMKGKDREAYLLSLCFASHIPWAELFRYTDLSKERKASGF